MAREDGLPNPETVGEIYLAKLLDEIRDLKQKLSVTVTPPNPDEFRAKEAQETKKRRDK